MVDFLKEATLQVVTFLAFVAAMLASGHAVLHKRDTRSAAGWVAVIWLAPVVGSALYILLGINRIRRRATELRRESLRLRATTEELRIEKLELRQALPEGSKHLVALSGLVDRVTQVSLTSGNLVEPLVNGDRAYPAMVEAIDAAQVSVVLYTYIFDNDLAGIMFVEALERAVTRGVDVKVLIDGVGVRYSRPSIVKTLRARSVRVALFLHSAVPWRMPYMNLRSHRKILIADGCTGFTGGMNIRTGHLIDRSPKSPVQDVHFRIRGPVVAQMMAVFAEDWVFATGEQLDSERWFPPIEEVGEVVARGIPDGPDGDLEKLQWTILGALAKAERSVRIVTPYFLPDTALITSINVAALRGVEVDIVLPEVNNLPLVKWAMDAQLWRVLRRGCRVHLGPAPFDHTKLMTVDGAWSLIGSANWDQRSLRLNFEFNIECYDPMLAQTIDALIADKIKRGRTITLAQMDARSLPVRLRDGVARLASPYL